jgi:2-polyprenyl-3-methyl-5-hydroxy-6-metoxy-1,4-benzoquinol methylase
MTGELQRGSGGDSSPEIHDAALSLAEPRAGLTWLDIGCGKGDLLRTVARLYEPARLIGIDLIDWLDEDLRDRVELRLGPAERVLEGLEVSADRVLMVETLEHLEAPWTALRAAGRRLAPDGRIVVSTPNVASLRHRLELLTRGRLTSFREDNVPHLTPVLPHVVRRVLVDEGLKPTSVRHAGRDVVPWTGGRLWPRPLYRHGSLASISVLVAARARSL